MSWRDDLAAVIGFYSRLPVPPPRAGMVLAGSVWIVPLAGVVIAAPAAAALVVASLLLPPLAAATIAVVVLTATTGALHEDGFADCADGFWGGHTPARRLEIMRDSRLGTFGVLALVAAVLLKVALVAEAVTHGAFGAAAIFMAAAVAGRTVALYPWVGLPSARPDGLAAAAGRPTTSTFRTALVLGLLVTTALTAPVAWLAVIPAAVAAAAAAKWVASVADARIGGSTGDVIGAAVVGGDVAYLVAFTIFT